jgi:hypothetical protein
VNEVGKASRAGKILAERRKIVKAMCHRCRKEITGISIRGFCGGACQRASYRERAKSVSIGENVPSVVEYYGRDEVA